MTAKELSCKTFPQNRIKREDTVFIKWNTAPLKVYGVFYDEREKTFLRVNRDFAEGFDDVFKNLNARTSGGRLRFKTNSPYIGLIAVQKNNIQLNNMTLCAHSGFDLYADNNYMGTFLPKTNTKNGFSAILETDKKTHDYTINFPLFDNVNDLYIAVSENAEILPAAPYINEGFPIIFYGSSITQGACASRPGLSYPAIIGRALNCDFINLGFSARCLGEIEMAKYIASMKKSAVVIDFDHNAPDEDYLKLHHKRFYDAVRESSKDLPVIIASAPDISYKSGFENRRDIILETFNGAKEKGEKVYFADGKNLFGKEPFECTVDNIHPNDMGLYNMASEFLKIFKNNKIMG